MAQILTVTAAFFCTSSVVLGIYILKTDPQKRLNQLFSLTTLVIAFFNFSALMIYSAESKDVVLFWYRLGGSTIFIMPLMLHTVTALVGLKKSVKYPLLMFYYLGTGYLYYQDASLRLTYRDFVKMNGIWIFIDAEKSVNFMLLGICIVSLYAICFILLSRAYRRSNAKREKKQIRIFILSLAVILFTFCIYLLVRPILPYPEIGINPLIHSVWPLGTAIAIGKYRFLGITHNKICSDIIENIEEYVVIAGRDQTVLLANPIASGLVPDLAKSRIDRLIEEYDAVRDKLEAVLGGSLAGFTAAVNYLAPGDERILMTARFSAIKDRFQDIIGVLVIARKIEGVREFLRKYGLTDREFTVIRLLMTGLSNKEISNQLNIAESTIKTHIEHIYNKTDVKNKIELSNLLIQSDLRLSYPSPV